MEEYMYIAAIVGCVFGILQIILFIKLWIMTNDIRKIKNKYLGEDNGSAKSEVMDQVKVTDDTSIRYVSILFTIASLLGVYYVPMLIGIAIVVINVIILVYAFTRK